MAESLSALQLALLAQRASDQRRLLAAEPIAVVGIGCRFPGGYDRPDIDNPDDFWEFLINCGDAITETPSSRWNPDRYHDSRAGNAGKSLCRYGACLESVDQFDPGCFGISPREAQAMDPQHRLLLEVAHEALERAALTPQRLSGCAAGVYLGLCTTDYAWRQLRSDISEPDYDLYFATGTTLSMAAGRLAYCLGLRGPALAVDTACSSSLVAVDLACRSLRDRTTDIAIAGGVSVLLSPVISLCFSRAGMLASDGQCKTFDASADGYVRGEGCGVVVLKRLADALAGGDPVLAVLRGSRVNQDGASAGLTVPSGEAQAQLILRTLEQAQLDSDTIDFLEAHGTGTPLGDPIELKAFAPIYARPGREQPLRVGSVKTNLGHLEGAAGIAGLLKAVLMVQHGRVPPHLHLREPTPYFPWEDWNIAIPTTVESWPSNGRPRRVAVSSFGFSGTNAHVLVEQAPAEVHLATPKPSLSVQTTDWLLLSARSESALHKLVREMVAWLAHQNPDLWPSICATSRCARSMMSWRLAIDAGSIDEAISSLGVVRSLAAVPVRRPRLAFRITDLSSERDWQAWAKFGIEATALVHAPSQLQLALNLAGSPPRLRIVPEGEDVESELSGYGYELIFPLEPPTPEKLIELWRYGFNVNWDPLQPLGDWQRQVLPATPFDRARYWINEREEDQLDSVPANLEHHQVWSLREVVRDESPKAPLIVLMPPNGVAKELARLLPDRLVVECKDLESMDRAINHLLAPTNARPDVLLATSANFVWSDLSNGDVVADFWASWLPLLQGLVARAGQLGRVHWWFDRLSPTAKGIAAMARSWSREAGDLSGALFYTERLEALADLLSLSLASSSECRMGPAGVEISTLELLDHCAIPSSPLLISPRSTTLITGGLGALGLASARVLKECGARHLTLVGRRPPNERQRQAIDVLEKSGVTVELVQLDITDPVGVEKLFDRLREAGRPLAGVIHAAGVIDDALIVNLTPERCAAVASAKVRGALLLDRFSRSFSHDFFVVYSSLAAVIGSPGQVPYSFANGFLDGLIHERRQAGFPGLSLAWGPWDGDGMAAQAAVAVERLRVEEGCSLLQRWLGHNADPDQIVLARIALNHAKSPLADRLSALSRQLIGLTSDLAQDAAESCLASVLAELGGFDASEIHPETRLDALGFDSLMTVELAAVVQAGLGVNLGLGALVGAPTLESLAAHLVALLDQSSTGGDATIDLDVESRLPDDLAQVFVGASASADSFPEAVLLTGATGFLGAFLLADQLERHPALTVFCLVRADSPTSAKARVRSNLERYGLWHEPWASRIVGLAGDLALPRLGLDMSNWEVLARNVTGILHNGAQLSYVASYGQLKAPNVEGTLEVLRLAASPLAHGLAPMRLEFISSTSVYEAAAYRGKALDEGSDLAEWEGIHLGYSQTKWVSERLVVRAAHAGLPVRIYRPPLIGGHSKTGAWHEQDFLHRLMVGCLALGQAPVIQMELDLVPVDYVVASVGALAWQPVGTAPDVLHLHHPSPVLWTDFLSALIELGAPLQPVELTPWLEVLRTDPGNPLYPLQPFFTHRWGPEQLTYPELNQPGLKAKPSCARTAERLDSLQVRCPSFEALLHPYARTFLEGLSVHA